MALNLYMRTCIYHKNIQSIYKKKEKPKESSHNLSLLFFFTSFFVNFKQKNINIRKKKKNKNFMIFLKHFQQKDGEKIFFELYK